MTNITLAKTTPLYVCMYMICHFDLAPKISHITYKHNVYLCMANDDDYDDIDNYIMWGIRV